MQKLKIMSCVREWDVVKKNSVEEGDGRCDLNRVDLTEKLMCTDLQD